METPIEYKNIEKELIDKRGFEIGSYGDTYCEYIKGFVVVTVELHKETFEIGLFREYGGNLDTPTQYIPMKNLKSYDQLDIVLKVVND